MKRELFLIAILILFLSFVSAGGELLPLESRQKNDEQSLSVKIMERLKLAFPNGTNVLRIWIPLPSKDNYQSVESLQIKSPLTYKIIKDPDFGNNILFIEVNRSPVFTSHMISGLAQDEIKSMEIKWEYQVKRNEQHGFLSEAGSSISNDIYLKERGLEIIDDRIRKIVKKVTNKISEPLEKAKALYNYVLTHVDYDTSIPGWGKGDVEYVCNVGKGNCTDFHSLFISLTRAAGIPARFRIGYPVPAEEQSGKLLKPYHCWAEFFIEGKGWTPVDISEAWKYPDKIDYYFGNLDKNRILISTGRDIFLAGEQIVDSPTINYFVAPYIELDGKRYNHYEIERTFVKEQ